MASSSSTSGAGRHEREGRARDALIRRGAEDGEIVLRLEDVTWFERMLEPWIGPVRQGVDSLRLHTPAGTLRVRIERAS